MQTVIAHTLAKPGPSPNVLEKTGFVYDGEVTDEEDGQLWRWRHDRTLRSAPEGQGRAEEDCRMIQRVGADAIEHARDRTFHYPYPSKRFTPNTEDELADVLKALSSGDANLVIAEEYPIRIRFQFSDLAALMLALQKHSPTRPSCQSS